MTSPAKHLDSELGELVRLYRLSAGLSQVELGEAAGISYQQIQKYESGANRVSVARLFSVASALGMSPSTVLGQLEKRLSDANGLHHDDTLDALRFMTTRRGQQVVRAMAACSDSKLLDAFIDLFLSATTPERHAAMNGQSRVDIST